LPATTSGFAGRSNLISQVSLNADRMLSEPEVSDLPQSGIDQWQLSSHNLLHCWSELVCNYY
jgi:hypothetical protein